MIMVKTRGQVHNKFEVTPSAPLDDLVNKLLNPHAHIFDMRKEFIEQMGHFFLEAEHNLRSHLHSFQTDPGAGLPRLLLTPMKFPSALTASTNKTKIAPLRFDAPLHLNESSRSSVGTTKSGRSHAATGKGHAAFHMEDELEPVADLPQFKQTKKAATKSNRTGNLSHSVNNLTKADSSGSVDSNNGLTTPSTQNKPMRVPRSAPVKSMHHDRAPSSSSSKVSAGGSSTSSIDILAKPVSIVERDHKVRVREAQAQARIEEQKRMKQEKLQAQRLEREQRAQRMRELRQQMNEREKLPVAAAATTKRNVATNEAVPPPKKNRLQLNYPTVAKTTAVVGSGATVANGNMARVLGEYAVAAPNAGAATPKVRTVHQHNPQPSYLCPPPSVPVATLAKPEPKPPMETKITANPSQKNHTTMPVSPSRCNANTEAKAPQGPGSATTNAAPSATAVTTPAPVSNQQPLVNASTYVREKPPQPAMVQPPMTTSSQNPLPAPSASIFSTAIQALKPKLAAFGSFHSTPMAVQSSTTTPNFAVPPQLDTTPVLKKATPATAPVTSAIPSVVASQAVKNTTALKSPVMSLKKTPEETKKLRKPSDNLNISPFLNSDDSDDDSQPVNVKIPAWARKENSAALKHMVLRSTADKNYWRKIFIPAEKVPFNLDDLFRGYKIRNRPRTSSAIWHTTPGLTSRTLNTSSMMGMDITSAESGMPITSPPRNTVANSLMDVTGRHDVVIVSDDDDEEMEMALQENAELGI